MFHPTSSFLHILLNPFVWLFAAGISLAVWRFRPRVYVLPKLPWPALAGIGLILAVILSAPYWIFGPDSSAGSADDLSNLLQAYLASPYKHGTFNWARGLLGGSDRLLLFNSTSPFSLLYLYTTFLQPQQMFLLINWINVALVFIFCWKIQRDLWKMNAATALAGSLVAVLLQGYWTGEFPDAHISNGHGLAIFPCIMYIVCRHQNNPRLLLMSFGLGCLFGLTTGAPVHNLPPLLVTIGLWGLAFFEQQRLKKAVLTLAGILTGFLLTNIVNLAALFLWYPFSGRSSVSRFSISVLFTPVVVRSCLSSIALLPAAAYFLRQDRHARRVLLFLAAFALMPLAALAMQKAHILSAFRWHLLFVGNGAPAAIAGFYLFDRIYKKIRNYHFLAGTWVYSAGLTAIFLLFLVNVFNSLSIDLRFSYPPDGSWSVLKEPAAAKMRLAERAVPFRILSYGAQTAYNFWGQDQGLEQLGGYTPVVNKHSTYFFYRFILKQQDWWQSGAITFLPTYPPVAGRNMRLDDVVNVGLLRLFNVRYIVSGEPFDEADPDLEFFYSNPGDAPACTDHMDTFLEGLSFGETRSMLSRISCMTKDYRLRRPLYVYRLRHTFERAYFAKEIKDKFYFSSFDEADKFMSAGNAYVESPPSQPLAGTYDNSGTIDITGYASDRISLNIHAPRQAFVLISEAYNPFWQLQLNGQKTPFYPANEIQVGFPVDAGTTRADFVYCPPFRLTRNALCR